MTVKHFGEGDFLQPEGIWILNRLLAEALQFAVDGRDEDLAVGGDDAVPDGGRGEIETG